MRELGVGLRGRRLCRVAGGLFQIDCAGSGGETGVPNGAGAGEAILNPDDVCGGVGEVGRPRGFSIYKEGKMVVAAGHAEVRPLGEVAAEAGEVGISAGYVDAGGIKAEVADAGFCGEGNNEHIVFTLYQYLDVLTDPGPAGKIVAEGGFESKVGVVKVSQILHIE